VRCSVLRAERSIYHYKGERRPQAVLMKRIKEIAETRVRYGGRRIRVQLRREGWRVNAKRVLRLCREIALQLCNKTLKQRVQGKLRDAAPSPSLRTKCGRWTLCTTSYLTTARST